MNRDGWGRSRARAGLRTALLGLLARVHRVRPRGTVHLFFHAIPAGQAASFSELLDHLLEKAPIVSIGSALQRDANEPCFTLSFDDGFKSNFAIAGRILKERNLPATIFVASEFIGLSGSELEAFTLERLAWHNVQEPMSSTDVRQCASLGIEIGSHGVSHKSFAHLSREEASRELAESKRDLEAMAGAPVRYFAWPFGTFADFPEPYVKMATDAGYEGVFSGVSRNKGGFPIAVQPRRELNLAWGLKACAYLAVRG